MNKRDKKFFSDIANALTSVPMTNIGIGGGATAIGYIKATNDYDECVTLATKAIQGKILSEDIKEILKRKDIQVDEWGY